MHTFQLLIIFLFACMTVQAVPQRREAILKAAGKADLQTVAAALNDPNLIVRRTALRSLEHFGMKAVKLLKHETIANSDPVTRRGALALLTKLVSPDEMLDIIEKVLGSEKVPLVRTFAVEIVASKRPASGRRARILAAASKNADPKIRAAISKALWPFYRKTTLLRDRHNWDSPIELVASVRLPERGWKFMKDPNASLHREKCFAPEYDVSEWRAIETGKFWEHFIGNYDGTGWYRLEFKSPAAPPEYNAVELNFGAVDEMAWVWLNGKFLGRGVLFLDDFDKAAALVADDPAVAAERHLRGAGENGAVVALCAVLLNEG